MFGPSISVPRRGAVAILGRNGAGKTTLLKTIMGEVPTMSGTVQVDGRDVTREPTEHRVRLGIGYVPQEHDVFAQLSVRENLEIGAVAAGLDRSDLDEALSIFPKLGARLNQQAGSLSGGERKMLAIGRVILARPRLLLLDEPTEGVWIGVIEEIAERLITLSDEIGILLVEQHLSMALRIADRSYVMERGRIVLEGSSEEVECDPKLVEYISL